MLVGSREVGSLVAANVGGRHCRTQHRVFAGPFSDASPARVASDIHHGRKRPADTGSAGLASRNPGHRFDHARIPGASQPQRDRENCSVAVNHVETEQQGYVQP